MRCSEPGHRITVAIDASRGPGRWAHLVRPPHTMSERFTYPPEMTQELQRETKRRFWFWLIFLSPFWFDFDPLPPMMPFETRLERFIYFGDRIPGALPQAMMKQRL